MRPWMMLVSSQQIVIDSHCRLDEPFIEIYQLTRSRLSRLQLRGADTLLVVPPQGLCITLSQVVLNTNSQVVLRCAPQVNTSISVLIRRRTVFVPTSAATQPLHYVASEMRIAYCISPARDVLPGHVRRVNASHERQTRTS